MKVMESDSMLPQIQRGDRFVFLNFGLTRFTGEAASLTNLPIRRGDIVLVSFTEKQRFFDYIKTWASQFVRFISAGRINDRVTTMDDANRASETNSRLYIKRVIALPGDEVLMTNYVVRVKPKDEPYTLTEFEVSSRHYDVNIPESKALWDDSLPFSSNMNIITLGEDQCFVMSDERSNTNDSRSWGPVSVRAIGGKALFCYWPLGHLGLP
jgi:signal peptidase I